MSEIKGRQEREGGSGQRGGQEGGVSEDEPREAGGTQDTRSRGWRPAHGWCSWGQSSPCGCSHTGSDQGQSGHRYLGAGMDSNNRGSLWMRNRDQRPPWGGARGRDSCDSSVLTHPKGPLCSHSYTKKPGPAVSGPCSRSPMWPHQGPQGKSPLPPCCHQRGQGEGPGTRL